MVTELATKVLGVFLCFLFSEQDSKVSFPVVIIKSIRNKYC